MRILFFLFLTSCSFKSIQTYRAYVYVSEPKEDGIDSKDFMLSQKLKMVSLPRLKDPATLSNNFFDFFVCFRKNDFQVREPARLVYRLQDDLIIPQDLNSLYLFSVYAHLEKIFEICSPYMPLEKVLFSKGAKKLSVYIVLDMGNNGAYSNPKGDPTKPVLYLDKFLFTQNRSWMPLSSFLGITAHELGHSCFFYLINEGKMPYYVLSSYVIRGLNEAYADLFSYTVTGAQSIYEDKIPFRADQNLLSKGSPSRSVNCPFSLRTFQWFLPQLLEKSPHPFPTNYYFLASLINSAFFSAREKLNLSKTTEGRFEFFIAVTKAFQKCTNILIHPTPAMQEVLQDWKTKESKYQDPIETDWNPQAVSGYRVFFDEFWSTFLTHLPSPMQLELCTELKNRFQSDGWGICPVF